MSVSETTVDLRTADGVMDCHVFQPAGAGPWPGVVLYMDAMGIRPDLKSMAARLSGHGYVVLLPNLYYRSGAFPPIDSAAFAKPGPERDRVFALLRSIDHTKVAGDTTAVLTHLGTQSTVRGKVGTVGYCMGGAYALAAAGNHPEAVGATAIFHAASLATDRPDSPHLLASRIQGTVYVGVAEIDHMFSDEERERLRQAFTDAGLDFTIEVYPNVHHGFCVTGHPAYDAKESERHWRELVRILGGALAA